MSIFNKDLIEEDLGYDPDIYKNIEFQIHRYFQKILSLYKDSPTCLNLMEWLQPQLDSFMLELCNETYPNFWKGPYKRIRGYAVIPFGADHIYNGFEIHYGLAGDTNYLTVPLIIYEEQYLDILLTKVRCSHGSVQ